MGRNAVGVEMATSFQGHRILNLCNTDYHLVYVECPFCYSNGWPNYGSACPTCMGDISRCAVPLDEATGELAEDIRAMIESNRPKIEPTDTVEEYSIM